MGEYIEQTLKSVLNQKLTDIEVIMVNDGSTDKASIKKFETLKQKYKNKVKFIEQTNKGLSAARNTGISHATSDYICCLDSDDLIESSYLWNCKRVFDADKEMKIAIATSWVKMFGEKNEIWETQDSELVRIMTDNRLQSASTFRKQVWLEVGKFDEAMTRGYEDWEFWLRIIKKGYRWDVIKKPLINYRIRKHSMVKVSDTIRADLIGYIINKHKDIYMKYLPAIVSIADKNFTFTDIHLVDYITKINQLEQRLEVKEVEIAQRNQLLGEISSNIFIRILRRLKVIKF